MSLSQQPQEMRLQEAPPKLNNTHEGTRVVHMLTGKLGVSATEVTRYSSLT